MSLQIDQCRMAAELVHQGAQAGLLRWQRGQVDQEPAITDRIFEAIESRFDGANLDGVQWRGYNLGDRGTGSPERQFGADGLIALDAQVAGARIQKGFLIQAKRNENGQAFSSSGYKRLRSQCRDMLRISSASVVWLYDRNRVTVVPATEIADTPGPSEPGFILPAERISESAYSFFRCTLGDPRFRGANIDELKRVVADSMIRRGLLLEASDAREARNH